MHKVTSLTVILLSVLLLTACTSQQSTALPQNSSNGTTSPTNTSEESPVAVGYKVEVYADSLFVPWSIVFTSADRVLVTERSGAVKVVEKGVVRKEPMITFDVSTRSEDGLLGMTLDPNYASNKYVYIAYTYASGRGADRVVRAVDEGDKLRVDKTLIEGVPAAQVHAGSRLKFGPDGKLYMTTGDASQKELAQDKTSLAGKILRMNSDGSIPSDNPFPNSYVWSYGHRNPQGIDWHPVTKTMWETEHGPSGGDGPGGGDEVNMIERAANYGWPVVSHDKRRDGMMDPQVLYTPAIAPGSGSFYTGKVFPQFENNFFYGALRGQGIYRAVLNTDGTNVLSHNKLAGVDVGRVRDVVTGPDGNIYFSSSNRDGRGSVKDKDDKIYRLVPAK